MNQFIFILLAFLTLSSHAMNQENFLDKIKMDIKILSEGLHRLNTQPEKNEFAKLVDDAKTKLDSFNENLKLEKHHNIDDRKLLWEFFAIEVAIFNYFEEKRQLDVFHAKDFQALFAAYYAIEKQFIDIKFKSTTKDVLLFLKEKAERKIKNEDLYDFVYRKIKDQNSNYVNRYISFIVKNENAPDLAYLVIKIFASFDLFNPFLRNGDTFAMDRYKLYCDKIESALNLIIYHKNDHSIVDNEYFNKFISTMRSHIDNSITNSDFFKIKKKTVKFLNNPSKAWTHVEWKSYYEYAEKESTKYKINEDTVKKLKALAGYLSASFMVPWLKDEEESVIPVIENSTSETSPKKSEKIEVKNRNLSPKKPSGGNDKKKRSDIKIKAVSEKTPVDQPEKEKEKNGPLLIPKKQNNELLTKKNEELLKKIKELELENKSQQKLNKNLLKKNQLLGSENKELNNSLIQINRELNHKKNENKNLMQQNNKLIDQNEKKANEIIRLQNKGKNASSKTSAAHAQDQSLEFKKELLEKENEVKILEEKNIELENKLKDLINKLDELKNNNHQKEQRIITFDNLDKVANIKQQNKLVNHQLFTLRKDFDIFTEYSISTSKYWQNEFFYEHERSNSYKEDITNLKLEIENLKLELQYRDNYIKHLNMEINELKMSQGFEANHK